MFFPWYRHSATRIFGTNLMELELDADEKEILRLCRVDGIDEESSFASLSYRRLEIRKKGDDWFHQEYPSTPEEAFITSGNPIFNPRAVRECFEEKTGATGRLYRSGRGDVIFEPDPHGSLTIFKQPHSDPHPGRYFVGGDPARGGTMTSDPSCAQVIHRSSLEQVAVWHGHADPVSFAREMMLIGDFFGHAMLCPEVEGGGMATIGAISQAGYGNIWTWKKGDRTNTNSTSLGWLSSYGTKRWAIGEMQDLLNTRSLLIHDKRTYFELLNFVEHENGSIGNEGRSGHDDTVMALSIAVTASKREGIFNPRYRTPAPLDLFTSELEAENILDLASHRFNERAS